LESGKYGITDSQGRHACIVCGRKFTGDRISRHENICMRRSDGGAKPVSSVSSKSVGKKQMTLSDLDAGKSQNNIKAHKEALAAKSA
jgi:hypothetical protein